MVTDITQNDLLLLAYNELSPDRKEYIESAISVDSHLKSQYTKLCSDMSLLDTVLCGPHDTTVQIIKEESCSSSAAEMA